MSVWLSLANHEHEVLRMWSVNLDIIVNPTRCPIKCTNRIFIKTCQHILPSPIKPGDGLILILIDILTSLGVNSKFH